jgi:dTMP kinase
MRGLFITMEGMDGCGKSTQLDMLARVLEARSVNVLFTREPGGTPIGEAVRRLLVADVSVGIAATTELFLIVGARAEHVTTFINPAIDAGKIVISDRYTDSTVAFQGYGRGLDLQMIDRMNELATGGLRPDLTLLFDLEPEASRARLSGRPVGGWLGAVDEEGNDFYTRVRNGYLQLARSEPDRIRVIDASGSPEVMHAQVLAVVLPLIEAVVSDQWPVVSRS